MKTSIEVLPNRCLLKIAGRFDLHVQRAFLDASHKLLAECPTGEIMIELADVTYIDSSALGMLLILREKANERGRTVALGHCKPFIRRILRTAQFDSLFVVTDG